MGTLYFVLAAATGFALTAISLAYFRKRRTPTHNQEAFILSIGFALTFLAAILLPFLATTAHFPQSSTIVFALVLSVGVGVMTYLGTRFLLWVRNRQK